MGKKCLSRFKYSISNQNMYNFIQANRWFQRNLSRLKRRYYCPSVNSELSLFEPCWRSGVFKTSTSVFGCSQEATLVIRGARTWWNQSDPVKSAEITFPCSATVIGGSVAQTTTLPWAEGRMGQKTSLNTVPIYSTFILGSKIPIKCESNVFEVLGTVFVFFFQFTLYRTK